METTKIIPVTIGLAGLGIMLFAVVPQSMLGRVIMPIGIFLTLWVLLKKVKSNTLHDYLFMAVVWTLIAIVCDYFLLVKMFKPTDGYYKLDVYLYYALTLAMSILVGWKKSTIK